VRKSRNIDWGFPRWRAYGNERQAEAVRLCDVEGCGKRGEHPAPKSSLSRERWWFCQDHAADYNRQWNYFAGLSDEQAQARAYEEHTQAKGYHSSRFWAWQEPASEGLRAQEVQALSVLGLTADADAEQIKSAYRRLAKAYHPDRNQDDPAAVNKFQKIKTAYEFLTVRKDARKA
jgi:hypothetical protein